MSCHALVAGLILSGRPLRLGCIKLNSKYTYERVQGPEYPNTLTTRRGVGQPDNTAYEAS